MNETTIYMVAVGVYWQAPSVLDIVVRGTLKDCVQEALRLVEKEEVRVGARPTKRKAATLVKALKTKGEYDETESEGMFLFSKEQTLSASTDCSCGEVDSIRTTFSDQPKKRTKRK